MTQNGLLEEHGPGSACSVSAAMRASAALPVAWSTAMAASRSARLRVASAMASS